MSEAVARAKPSADGKAAAPAVIRKLGGAEETSKQRLMKKHIPAWVISGGVHVALIAALIFADRYIPKTAVAKPADDVAVIVQEEKEDESKPPDLTQEEVGLTAELPPATESTNVAEANVESKTVPDAPVGADVKEEKNVAMLAPMGTDLGAAGVTGDLGMMAAGGPGGGSGETMADAGLRGRSGGTKNDLIAKGGGSSESEAAVARGLAWLAKQQKANGSWVYDGNASAKDAVVASTGMALLPFLAAGQTHKPFKENKYQKTVKAGLEFLMTNLQPDGKFKSLGGQPMYAQAIGSVALCEAFGMTNDKSFAVNTPAGSLNLKSAAQKSVDFIAGAQGPNGSWGYEPNSAGDTSIVGWQIQALHSAKLCKDLVVKKSVFENARKFLDSVADKKKKSTYGYAAAGDRGAAGTPTLNAIGLLCRYYVDGWGPNAPGMAEGVASLMRPENVPTKEHAFDMYYYYYSTQVVHFFDGPEWHKQWNPTMRDMLIAKQVKEDKSKDYGSWEPDGGSFLGPSCARLGSTCMSLLTLEVYYRHLPLYKRDTGGLNAERAR